MRLVTVSSILICLLLLLAVDSHGSLVVVDTGNHRVMRWISGGTSGEVIVGSSSFGSGLHQLYSPSGIAVTRDGCIMVADSHNHRVVCWVPGQAAGILVAGGHGAGRHSTHLSYPSDVKFEVLCPWSPVVHNASGSSTRALVKLMLTIDVSRSKRGLVALGSTLIIAVMSWALPLQRQCQVCGLPVLRFVSLRIGC